MLRGGPYEIARATRSPKGKKSILERTVGQKQRILPVFSCSDVIIIIVLFLIVLSNTNRKTLPISYTS